MSHSTSNTKTVKRAQGLIGSIMVMALLIAGIAGLRAGAAYGAESVDVSFTVNQTITISGSTPLPNEVFSYCLVPEQSRNPMPNGCVTGVQDFDIAGQSKTTISINFNCPGVYEYKLFLTTPHATGYNLDEKVYSLKVTVLNDMTLIVMISDDAGTKVNDDNITYDHAFGMRDVPTEPSDPGLMLDPLIVKTVQGNPAADATFTFRLKALDPSSPMPQQSNNGIKDITIKGSGQASFGSWSYAQEGTYFYTISEVVPSAQNGYTYDTTTYTIIDKVHVAENQYVLTRQITNNLNKPVTSCSFINTYNGSGETPPLITQPPKTPYGPKTGDDSGAMFYLALLIVAVVTAFLCTRYLRYERRIQHLRKHDPFCSRSSQQAEGCGQRTERDNQHTERGNRLTEKYNPFSVRSNQHVEEEHIKDSRASRSVDNLPSRASRSVNNLPSRISYSDDNLPFRISRSDDAGSARVVLRKAPSDLRPDALGLAERERPVYLTQQENTLNALAQRRRDLVSRKRSLES